MCLSRFLSTNPIDPDVLILGTISVAYLVTFITVKAANWGFHLDFHSENQPLYVPRTYACDIILHVLYML